MKLIHLLFIGILFIGNSQTSDEKPNTPQQNTDLEAVTIGTQVWMLKNLDVTTYRNGDTIPQVTNPIQWTQRTSGAWCYMNDDPAMAAIYGKLYNWYAVNDPRGLAPTGWHVPTDDDWKTLEMSLNMMQSQADVTGWRGTDEGGKLKETGTLHWNAPNTGATNSSGFVALPGGYRYDFYASFGYVRSVGFWWSSTEYSATSAWGRNLSCSCASVSRTDYRKPTGFSVRCLKD